ncbi:MAG: hypothetical protein QE487_02865 [Fluviicola sp.]|nr:hypothetical protein [Fluviicola sp.]
MLKYIFPLMLVLTACGGNDEKENPTKKTEAPKVIVSFENEAEMDERVVEIDAIVNQAGTVASSLYYSKGEAGESIQVDGHMNAENQILKIEEFFSEGNGKNSGRRLYYLNDGRPFLTVEQFDDVTGTKPQFVDRVSYYDEKGKVMKTKERRGDYQEVVETMKYKPVALAGVSMDRAKRALNQEKEFQTTFQGFIDSDQFSYMSVGENNPDGFHSALRCDFKDPLIMTLSSNQQKYIGKKLRVNYQKHTDASGFEFQVYLGGEFADE